MTRLPQLVGALVAVAVIAWAWLAHDWPVEQRLAAARGLGWAATVALLLALVATPLGRVAGRLGRSVRVAKLRRALGVTAAGLATAHVAAALAGPLSGAWQHVLDLSWTRAGLGAFAILLALWLTSYPRVVRALGITHWKALHRLAYVAGLLAFQHAILAPLAPRGWVLLVFGAAAVLASLRFLPRRRSPSKAREHGPSTGFEDQRTTSSQASSHAES